MVCFIEENAHWIPGEVRKGELEGTRPEEWRWVRRGECQERGVTGMTRKALGL